MLRSGIGLNARRIQQALESYQTDLLFLHRDAEAEPPAMRRSQIMQELDAVKCAVPAVLVIPVRMTEAWLLFDEVAIRRAAGLPSGRMLLDLPPAPRWEELPNAKAVLHDRLLRATGKTGRHRHRFRPDRAVHRVAELIDDFAPLLALPAFTQLDLDVRNTLQKHGWVEY